MMVLLQLGQPQDGTQQAAHFVGAGGQDGDGLVMREGFGHAAGQFVVLQVDVVANAVLRTDLETGHQCRERHVCGHDVEHLDGGAGGNLEPYEDDGGRGGQKVVAGKLEHLTATLDTLVDLGR